MREEVVYNSHEASQLTAISTPAIRKYCLILEKETGYTVTRINDRGDRRFSEQDLAILRSMKELSDKTNMNVSSIARIVVAKHRDVKQDDFETAIEPVSEMDVLIGQASQSYWQQAKRELAEEISAEVTARVREELVEQFQDEFTQLRTHLANDLRTALEEVAAAKQNKRWWKFFK